MGLKVLIVHADYNWSIGTLQKEPSYAEGLASVSAVLKEEGNQVSLYHMLQPEKKEDFCSKLEQEEADVIGFTTRTTFYPSIKELTAWAREACPSSFIICGGYHASLVPEEIMELSAVDAVCIGEGEYPLLELCRGLEQGEDVSKINNLWVRTPRGVVKNAVRPLIEDLDSLSIPDFDLFDYPNLAASQTGIALVMVSRGCPYSCTYCCNHRFRSLYSNKRHYSRFRSPEGAVEYLKVLLGKHPFIKQINFMDNILILDKEWLRNFTILYKKEIGLPFACRVRPNLMDEETAFLLKDAGCHLVFQGIEAGNPYILNEVLFRKTSIRQIENSFYFLKKAGIQTLAYNMVGLPYENLSKALETIRLNAKIEPHKIIVSPFYPYPETELHRLSLEEGFIPENIFYEDTVLLQQPDFPREHVKFAHRYFNTFVRFYRFTKMLPQGLRNSVEKMLGYFFCTPYKPHWLLNKAAFGRDYLTYHSKKIIRIYFPSLYIFLRNLFDRRQVKQEQNS